MKECSSDEVNHMELGFHFIFYLGMSEELDILEEHKHGFEVIRRASRFDPRHLEVQ